MSDILDNPWFRKYQPKTIDDMVLHEDIKRYFQTENINGNILFIGAPGIGKTSLAKIIPNLLECQYLYINASDENGIDTIRNKIINFVQTKAIFGGKKVVICDEACGLSGSAQQALRNVMEEYSDTSIFVLTANYSHKIKDAIKSRCKSFDLTYPVKDFVKHILDILKKENITITKDLILHVNTFYPDFRKCLNDLEKRHSGCEIHLNKDIQTDNFGKELWDNLNKTIPELRGFILNNISKFENDYNLLAKKIFDYICYDPNIRPLVKSESLIIIGEIIRTQQQVVDVEINFFSKLIEIREIKTKNE